MTVPVPDLLRVFGRIGILSFGGPAAQIALMHRELVETRPWLTEKQFLGALSFCMLLPGPEAMQLATYCGWRLRGVAGGLIAGGLFVLPGAIVVLALALAYAAYGALPGLQAAFLGVKAAVVIIVVEALLKLSRKALRRSDNWILAVLSFVAIFFLSLPFPLIIAVAALYGALRGNSEASGVTPAKLTRTPATTVGIFAAGGAVWAAPLMLAAALNQSLLTQIGLYFSKLAVVTFGGAYAVLAYMTQAVVEDYGWLTTAEMMDGLGLAETTPGPLILVTEFVGALAAHAEGGPGLALIGAALTLWVTFVPCFIWIFAGAPYIEWITHQPRLKAALEAITAAVVGVIANLSLWFAAHVFFADIGRLEAGPISTILPRINSLEPIALALAILAGLLLLRLRWNLLYVLALLAGAGWLTGLLA